MTERSAPDDFARTAYQIIVVEGRPSTAAVAEILHLGPRELRARLVGRVPFSATEINRLLRAVPDMRLIEVLLSATSFGARRPDPGSVTDPETSPLGNTALALEKTAKAAALLCQLARTPTTSDSRQAIDAIDQAYTALERVLDQLEAR